MNVDKSENLLSQEEMYKLVMALKFVRKEKDFKEEEAQKVIAWAEYVRIESHLLELVLDGKLLVDTDSIDRKNFEDIKFTTADGYLSEDETTQFNDMRDKLNAFYDEAQ